MKLPNDIASLHTILTECLTRLSALELENTALKSENDALKLENAKLRRRLGLNSKNSSKSPSNVSNRCVLAFAVVKFVLFINNLA